MFIKKKNAIVCSIITFLLVYLVCTPFAAAAVESESLSTSNSTNAKYITLLDDYHLIAEDEEWGLLRKGSSLYVNSNAEGENTIQIGTKEVVVGENFLFESNQKDVVDYLRYSSDEAYKTLLLSNETIFADSEFTREMGHINELDYPILNETEHYYEVSIGNVIGYVKKAQLEQKETEEQNENSAALQFETSEVDSPSSYERQADSLPDVNSQPTIQSDIQETTTNAQPVSTTVLTNPNYFTVKEDTLSVYDNSSGSLVKVGALIAGQVYPKISTEGNWIKVKYGNGYGFVWKGSTVDADPSGLKNLNQGAKISTQNVISSEYLSVYDNTSGGLVRFGSIQPNTKYPIIAPAGNWYKIDYAGRIGYIYKPSAKLVFNGNENYFKVTTDTLSIYDNSSGSLKKVGSLNQDQEFPILSFSGNWIKMKYRGKEGFVWKESTEPSTGTSIKNANKGLVTSTRKVVSNKYLSVYDNTSGSLVQFASIEPNTEYPIIDTVGNWHRIDVSGRIGYIYKSATKYVFNTDDRYFKVTEDKLPIYDNRTGSLIAVGTLEKNQVYQRVSDAGNWHKIQYGNIDGYVLEDSTTIDNGSSIKTSPFIGSKDNFLALKDVPVYDNSTGSLVSFATLQKGQVYPYVKQSGSWYEVQLSGRTGFVYSTGVRKGPTINTVNYSNTLSELVQLHFNSRTRPQTDKNYRTYVREDALTVDNESNPTKGIAKSADWIVRGGPGASHWDIGKLKDKEEVQIINVVPNDEDGFDWYEIKYDRTWVNASPNDIKYYLDSNNFRIGQASYYQYLKLSGSAQISVKEVNEKILANKGILTGKAETFAKAGLTNNINEIYLISHALLETGNGQSELASGIKVKKKLDQNGNIVYTNAASEKLVEIEVLDSSATDYDAIVYNMYGIHAFDHAPTQGGARKAFNEGWTSPEKAIIGGANIIAQNYIYNGQDTLYKMRWNPDTPGTHQYATDIAWAYKQTNRMYNLYSLLDSYYQVYDIPVYKN